VAGVFEAVVAKKHTAEARRSIEDALEHFIGSIPAWRGGQREAGCYLVAAGEEERGRSRDRPGNKAGNPVKASSLSSASRSRSRQKRREKEKKGKDKKKDKDKEKDKEKEKEKEKDRRREKDKEKEKGKDRSRSQDRRREKERERSRSQDEPRRARPPSPEQVKPPRAGFAEGPPASGAASKVPANVLGLPMPSLTQAAVPGVPPPSGAAPAAPAATGGAPAAGAVPDWLSDIVTPAPVVGPGGLTGIAPLGGVQNRSPAHREILVPQQYVSRLIGKGGETIMGICHQTGADVKIRQETKELGYSLAVITGRPEAVDAAERLVFEKLNMVGERFSTAVKPIVF